MSSPAWWEAHHAAARPTPGTSWFGPLARRLERLLLGGACPRRRRRRAVDAVVLGSGYSRTVDRLAQSLPGLVVGVDSSRTAVVAMRAARWSRRARFVATEAKLFRHKAPLVIDEGVLDLVRTATHLAAALRLVAPGGALAVLGFAGPPGLIVNGSANVTAYCVLSRPLRLVAFEHLTRHHHEDPALACSPYRYGSYLLLRDRPGYRTGGGDPATRHDLTRTTSTHGRQVAPPPPLGLFRDPPGEDVP